MAELLGKGGRCGCRPAPWPNQVALRTPRGRATRSSRAASRTPPGTNSAAPQPTPACRSTRSARAAPSAPSQRAAVKPRHPDFPDDDAGRGREHAQPRRRDRLPQAEVLRICDAARELGPATFDGARLWNASAATGVRWTRWPRRSTSSRSRSARAWARPAARCWRVEGHTSPRRRAIASVWRRCARTASAAAALHALDHHLARLVDDHANARVRRAPAARAPVLLDLATVQTNIVVFHPHRRRRSTADARRAGAGPRRLGVLNAFAARTVRSRVTHLDVDRPGGERAATRRGGLADENVTSAGLARRRSGQAKTPAVSRIRLPRPRRGGIHAASPKASSITVRRFEARWCSGCR